MAYFYLFLFGGIFYFFGHIFSSGWETIPSSLIDGIFTNYILEHFYLFVTGKSALHSSLLTMPFYYPMQHNLALSDTFIPIAPIYIFFRTFFDYAMSYTMTVMSFAVLNYITFYFILRKLKYSKLLSSLGAFLFAFSYVNKLTMLHIQLTTLFFSLGAVLALLNISKHNTKKKNRILFITAATLYVLQFYAAYYLAFFDFLLVILGVIICLFSKKLKKVLKIFILRYSKDILLSTVYVLVLIFPIVTLYLHNNITRSYELVENNIQYYDVLFTGLTFFVQKFLPSMVEEYSIEKMLMFTYALFIFGMIGLSNFKRYGNLLCILVIVSILLISKSHGFEDFILWKYIYYSVPGAVGIREPIRLILLLNGFLVLGFVNFLAKTKWPKFILVLLVLFVLFEQYTDDKFARRSFHNELAIQNSLDAMNLPDYCKYIDVAFYSNDMGNEYFVVQQDLARVYLMWYTLRHDYYFISGYSGITESDNPHLTSRDKMKNDKGYCLILKNIHF